MQPKITKITPEQKRRHTDLLPNNPSLRSKLLLQLVVPLVIFMALESIMSYFGTLHYVNGAYDGWLLDSARSLAHEIKVQNNKIVIELPPAALEMFKWDEQDKTYFKIISDQGMLIAGDAAVPDLKISSPLKITTQSSISQQVKAAYPSLDWSKPIYFNSEMYGEPVQVVAMLITPDNSPEKVLVSVAETEHKRRQMMMDILVADLMPQILLLTLMGLYLLIGIKRSLKPLHQLADEIAKRSSRDLRPIPETDIVIEAHVLIHTINALFKRLNLAIATQERFIANAAHQLRTPLAGLKIQAERALREQNITDMQPALVQMLNSADRLSHLTSQLLVLARAEPNQHNEELHPLDLVHFAREICIDWAPKALERKMELNFEGCSTPTRILGDVVLLRELLLNLLDNATTYGADKGTVWVIIRNQPTPQLTIMDNGPGIPTAEIEKVFERFYRIPGSKGNGCGLGLAIVKEIVDLHHAELQLNSLQSDDAFQQENGLCIDIRFTAFKPLSG